VPKNISYKDEMW